MPSLVLFRPLPQIGLGASAESRREMLGVESSIASQTSLYREAITAFQNAVKLNRMLSGVWFKLGCAALRVEDWETGA